jgi:hypothetical protein
MRRYPGLVDMSMPMNMHITKHAIKVAVTMSRSSMDGLGQDCRAYQRRCIAYATASQTLFKGRDTFWSN